MKTFANFLGHDGYNHCNIHKWQPVKIPMHRNIRFITLLLCNTNVLEHLGNTQCKSQWLNINFNKSGIYAKKSVWIANGHISLSLTRSITSGIQIGSSAIGTGTSLATFGSIGASVNVNGKGPYAGSICGAMP